jgi:hypothetical protein
MELFGLLGVAALALASLAVGSRLVWLSSRSGQAPELWIGLSYLFAGFLSCVATLIAGELARSGSPLRGPVGLVGAAALHAGVICLALFVWSVFHRGSALGSAAAIVACAFVLATFFGLALDESFPVEGVARGLRGWSSLAGRVGVYTWASVASFREFAAARKRVRIGLADPLVVNRLFLWGAGTSCVLALWIHSGAEMARGVTDPTASYPVIAVLGITCAATSWLAFFPPAWYRRRFVGVTS